MKKITLALVSACLLPTLVVGQTRFKTGSAVLDNRLQALEFFQRKYDSNQAFFVENVTPAGNQVKLLRLDQINRLNLTIACKYGEEQPGVIGPGGYVMFGAEVPNGCKTTEEFAMVDDLFGTNIRFNIALNTYSPQGKFLYRSASYGLIDNAAPGLNDFIFMLGCFTEKYSFFNYPKTAKQGQFRYAYTFTKRKVRKLSELVALDAKGADVMRGFKDDLAEGTYQLTTASNASLVMQHSAGVLSLATIDAKSPSQLFKIKRVGKNLYTIAPQSTGGIAFLTRNDSAKKYGASSEVKPKSQDKRQQWFLLSDNDGSYYIVNGKGGCMDVEGGRISKGSAVGLWATTGSMNQKWRIVKVM